MPRIPSKRDLVLSGLAFLFLVISCYRPALALQDIRIWQYADYNDNATGLRFHTARKVTRSLMDAPHGGLGGRIILTADRSLHLQFDVLIHNGYGYVDCATPCAITIQFDDNDPIEVKGRVLSRTDIALDPAADLINDIVASTRMRITAPVQEDGQVVFDFDTRELEWPRDNK